MISRRQQVVRKKYLSWIWASRYSRRSSSSIALQKVRVCIVGAGPAGFYTAKYLMKELSNVQVHILDALPTPYGLVRYGVAPDHPEVKSVINDFEIVASDSRCRFVGNISVGEDISVEELKSSYNVIVMTYGASDDKALEIPGEELQGVFSARAFVNWYNGHPSFRDLNPDLSGKVAVIFGHGNVAVDCARILLKPVHELENTDISTHALEVLRQSKIQTVHLVGRRGSSQAAFTMKEIRELTKLPSIGCVLKPEDLNETLNKASIDEISASRPKKRMNEMLGKIASTFDHARSMERQLHIRFLSSPVEFIANINCPEKVGSVRIEKTKLNGNPNAQRALGTGCFETVPCDLALRSIGYKSHPIVGLPFDSNKHVISNVGGRVVDPDTKEHIIGLYCAGWVKRGPSGIIGSNIIDARETVAKIMEDVRAGNILSKTTSDNDGAIFTKINKRVTSWKDFQVIDREEVARGIARSKTREKVASVEDMIKILDK